MSYESAEGMRFFCYCMERMSQNNLSFRASCLILFLILFGGVAYVHQGGTSWNQSSRLALLHVFVEEGRFSIDSLHNVTGDKSFFDGHYYSDKAPGIAFLALPAFTISWLVAQGAGVPPRSQWGWELTSWITTVGSVGLLAALGGVAFYTLLVHHRLGKKTAFLATVVMFFGSLSFSYATALFSHGAVIGLLCIALSALLTTPQDSSALRRRLLLAGFVSGLAVSGDFMAMSGAGGVFLLSLRHGWRNTFFFLSAFLFPVLLVPLNSIFSFGSPFVIGYSYEVIFTQMNAGFFGIHAPSLRFLAELLAGPAYGLFFWSPFFLLAVPGYVLLFHRDRWLFWVTLLIPIIHAIIISGYFEPRAGFALGPRYLSSVLPFLMLPAAYGFRQSPIVGSFLAVFSIILTGGATLVTSTPPQLTNPLYEFYFPRWEEGSLLAHNMGKLMGLPGWWSIAPLAAFVVILSVYVFLRLPEEPMGNTSINS